MKKELYYIYPIKSYKHQNECLPWQQQKRDAATFDNSEINLQKLRY